MASLTNIVPYYVKPEMDDKLSQKADVNNVFSVAEAIQLFAEKQNVITDDDLTISMTSGLQQALDNKQDVIQVNGLAINKVSNLENILSSKVDSVNVYSKNEVNQKLGLKQDVIAVNGLQMNQVSGLQSALNEKQPVITAGSLNSSAISDLSSLLASKQNVIADGGLSLQKIAGLETVLDGKSDKINTYNKLQVDNLLGTKQPIISSNDLTVDMVAGLEDALNMKQSILPSQNALMIEQITGLEPLLNAKANSNSVYNKASVDQKVADVFEALNNITAESIGLGSVENVAVADMVLLKTQVEGLEDDLDNVYTKSQVNNAIATAVAPKANSMDVFTKVETQGLVDNAVSALVNSAPLALNTLSELATALGNDANFSTTLLTEIGTKAPSNNPTFTGTEIKVPAIRTTDAQYLNLLGGDKGVYLYDKFGTLLLDVLNTGIVNQKPTTFAQGFSVNGSVTGLNQSMVGLSNVNNTSDLNKPISTATQSALNLKANSADVTSSLTLKQDLVSGSSNVEQVLNISNQSNSYRVRLPSGTSQRLYIDAKNPTTGTWNDTFSMDYDDVMVKGTLVSNSIGNLTMNLADKANKNNETHSGTTNFSNIVVSGTVTGIDKSKVGLANVDNTPDVNKPVSTATQNALNLKANSTDVTSSLALKQDLVSGSSNVEQVIDISNQSNAYRVRLPAGTNQRLYIDAKNPSNGQWFDTFSMDYNDVMVKGTLIGSSIGNLNTNLADKANKHNETHTGTTNFSSIVVSGPVTGIDKTKVGLANVDNTSDLDKPISTAVQTALNLKANQSSLTSTNGDVTTLSNRVTALESASASTSSSSYTAEQLRSFADDWDARDGAIKQYGLYYCNGLPQIRSLYDVQKYYDLGSGVGGISTSVFVDSTYTLEGWFYLTSAGSEPTFFALEQNGSFNGTVGYTRLGLSGGGNICVENGNGVVGRVDLGTQCVLNTWFHIALQVNTNENGSAKGRVYYNGSMIGSSFTMPSGYPQSLFSTSCTLYVGCADVTISKGFRGRVSNPKLSNVLLYADKSTYTLRYPYDKTDASAYMLIQGSDYKDVVGGVVAYPLGTVSSANMPSLQQYYSSKPTNYVSPGAIAQAKIIIPEYVDEITALANYVPQWAMFRTGATLKLQNQMVPLRYPYTKNTNVKITYDVYPWVFAGNDMTQTGKSNWVVSTNWINSLSSAFPWTGTWAFAMKGKLTGNYLMQLNVDPTVVGYGEPGAVPQYENATTYRLWNQDSGTSGNGMTNVTWDATALTTALTSGFILVIQRESTGNVRYRTYNASTGVVVAEAVTTAVITYTNKIAPFSIHADKGEATASTTWQKGFLYSTSGSITPAVFNAYW